MGLNMNNIVGIKGKGAIAAHRLIIEYDIPNCVNDKVLYEANNANNSYSLPINWF